MAGSKPGERRGGRKAGTPNRATADVKAVAQEYTAQAIQALAKLGGLLDGGAGKAESEQAQVSALREILDRGCGKPAQTIAGDPENPLIQALDETSLAQRIAFLLTKQR